MKVTIEISHGKDKWGYVYKPQIQENIDTLRIVESKNLVSPAQAVSIEDTISILEGIQEKLPKRWNK